MFEARASAQIAGIGRVFAAAAPHDEDTGVDFLLSK
jgi:hypothetical protein